MCLECVLYVTLFRWLCGEFVLGINAEVNCWLGYDVDYI